MSTDCRVEGCTVLRNLIGISAGQVGNLIVGNRASGNTSSHYNIAVGNFVGTIVTTEAAMNTATNSLVNVSY
jgi:parallel beta-helix repeat protein